jgi:phosphopantothenate---cysteine ligase (CTP)
LNLIITAGGTRERIDAVRTITNDATGKLGSLLGEEFSRRLSGQEHTIYYMCGVNSIAPCVEDSSICIIRIEGTQQLQNEMSRLLTMQHIDAVIHSMAVSDYKVSYVTTPELIAKNMAETFNNLQTSPSIEQWRNIIQVALTQQSITGEQKISSELASPVLVLEKTPKIIEMIKKTSPQTVLVGFKLLSGVSKEVLIQTAYGLLERDQCDFVLANDTDSIKNGNHEGYLIDSNEQYIQLSGKEQIAKEIVDNVLKKLLEGVK